MCHCYYTKHQTSIRCIEFIPTLFHPFSSPTVTSHTLQLSSTIHASGRMVMVVGLDCNLVSVKAVLVDGENLSYLKIKLRQLGCFSPQLTLQVLRWPGRLRTFSTKLVLKVKLNRQNQHGVLYLLPFLHSSNITLIHKHEPLARLKSQPW